MARSFAFTLFVVLVLWSVPGARAQGEANPDSALQATLQGLAGSPLSLRQAVGFALGNAPSLQMAEAGYRASADAVRREQGVFDPRLFFTMNYLDQKLPTASFFAGAPILSTQQTTTQSGLSMNLPIGTQIQLSLNTARLATNSAFAFLNPEYDAFGSLTVRQPLLGGFTVSARKQLSQAERQSEGGKDRLDQQVLSVTTSVEQMYWDLYAAERNFAVQILTRDRAAAFLKETQLRARAGLVGPDQVANARTFLAQQVLQLLESEETLDGVSDRLASLIGTRPAGGANRFITTDEPASSPHLDAVDTLVALALRGNLELQAAQKDVEAASVLADAASWEALPSVDVVGSLGGTGLGGNAQGVIFNGDTLRIAAAPGFGDAVRQVYRRQYPNWSVGIEVSIPIGLRSGMGEKSRLEEEVIKAQQAYLEKQRVLEERVRSTCRELMNGKSRLDAAREGVTAAQEQVRVGIIEFRNGRSTAFELVRLGEDLAVAEQRYSQELVRTAKAAATLTELTSGAYRATTHE
jgi:outer membrane protein